jgi:hypothetical protein
MGAAGGLHCAANSRANASRRSYRMGVLLESEVESIVKGELAVPTAGLSLFCHTNPKKGVAMATIRNQRNSNLVVLKQDAVTLNRDSQAVCAPGSIYLPSVSGFMFLQPSRKSGCKHETTRHLDHAMAKLDEPMAWSGSLGRTGLRASSVITIN